MQSSKYLIWLDQNPYEPQLIIPKVGPMVKFMLTIYFTVYLKVTFKVRPTDRLII